MTRNYESTKIIAEWTWINNAILIYSSSAAIYGINNQYPSNLYGWSKYVGEDAVTISAGISLRYFNVYGDDEQNKGDQASPVSKFTKQIKETGTLNLFEGSDKFLRDFIWVGDLIEVRKLLNESYIDQSGVQMQEKDVFLTGKFLITAISHDIILKSGGPAGVPSSTYTMRIKAIKDSKGGEYA